jgi:hypothetical protein
MTEPLDAQEINDLFTKLDGFAAEDLNAKQRELLTTMITVARAVIEVENPDAQQAFAAEFDAAFQEVTDLEADYGQCKMVSRKVGTGRNQVFITQMISR